MHKKSQVTVFIIAGVVILIIAAIFFSLRAKSSEITESDRLSLLGDKSAVIRNYVDDCLSKELDNALQFISLQGGYVYRPALGLARDNYNIAYDYYLGVNLLPTFEEVEQNEISAYLQEYLPKCLESSGILNEEFITLGNASITADILEESVKVDVDYPITLTAGTKQQVVEKFSAKKDVSLGMMMDVSNDIIKHTIKDPNWIDLGFLESLGLDVEVIHIDENTIVYKIKDPAMTLKGETYYFMFSALFTDNSPPDLFTFSDYTVKAGEVLEIQPYALDFNGDMLTYSADSSLLNIDPVTGFITFKPMSAGDYNFNIKVDDGNGMFDSQPLKVKVI